MCPHKSKLIHWKGFHRWAGLFFALFMVIFCISGVILNHRQIFAKIDVSRGWLPDSYKIRNYNNGVVQGTVVVDSVRLLAYGCNGIWLADRDFRNFRDFNSGLPEGADNRNIKNIIIDRDDTIWCATPYGIYKYNGHRWAKQHLDGNDERIVDIAMAADSISVVAMTRSAVYVSIPTSTGLFVRREIKPIPGHEVKYSLFKTIWQLHSGELFGLAGRIIVDFIAIVIAFLCLTGIIIFICPYLLRRNHSNHVGGIMKWNFRWHDRLGYYPFIFTLLIAVTGMCLRPPLMIPFVIFKTAPLPGSAMDSDNQWHDSLRGIRWDSCKNQWLISTTEGFAYVDRDFASAPALVSRQQCPPVSPMGVTVMQHETDNDSWLIGSFSGLYRWDTSTGIYHSIKPQSLVSGYSSDIDVAGVVVFDYADGASVTLPTSDIVECSPMSLWNFALELHVGRCYTPLLGPLSSLFVFIFGLALTLILISGYIVSRRIHKKKSKH